MTGLGHGGRFRAWLVRHGDHILYVAAFLHVWICPYTKVEESFNLQACHDILYHKDRIDEYDHHQFPGVVPRTFLGPAVVSALAYPLVYAANLVTAVGQTKILSQIIVRCVLAGLVVRALNNFRSAVRAKFGESTWAWHTVLTLSQFHLLFYAGRTLPNTFALVLALHALAFWLEDKQLAFIVTSAVAIVVFRAELAIFLGTLLLMDWAVGRVSLFRIIPFGSVGLVLALALTVPLDTLMWKHDWWLWPEGYVIYYNVILNMSHNWGTMPWAWYFYSAIPRAMFASLPFVLAGVWMDKRRTLILTLPCLVFVTVYSFLPHKELRFIIYVLPVLNVVAAEGAKRVFASGGFGGGGTTQATTTTAPVWRKVLALSAVGHVLVNLAFTAFMVYVSHKNYPGGQAFKYYHNSLAPKIIGEKQQTTVHIDVFSAQTGVSRFGQIYDDDGRQIKYDKTEDVTDFAGFKHLIMENNATLIQELLEKGFHVVKTVKSYAGISVNYMKFPPVTVKTHPSIAILEKKSP